MVYGQQKFRTLGVGQDLRRRADSRKSFQYKYSTYLTIVITGSAFLFFLPALYFISQNYQIFTNLAFDSHPSLVQHLDREINWIRFFLVASLVTICLISFFMSLKVMNRILDPGAKIEQHLQGLTHGKWNQPEVVISHDDFKNLSVTYNYFYRTLIVNTEIELKMLEKLAIDPQNREAHAAWMQLMDIKRQRLGLSEAHKALPIGRDEQSGEAAPLRRVS